MNERPTPEQIDLIRYAWTVEGPPPKYHRAAKRKLKAEWPRLYEALSVAFGSSHE